MQWCELIEIFSNNRGSIIAGGVNPYYIGEIIKASEAPMRHAYPVCGVSINVCNVNAA